MHCESKSRYPSRARANQYRRARQRTSSIRLLIYFCDECHGYHLTSRDGKRESRPDRRRL